MTATLVAPDQGGTLVGTPGDDVIVGSDANDHIDGLGGNDLVCARAGADTVIGGEGDDRLLGGEDRDDGDGIFLGDTVAPGPGDDVVDLGTDSRREGATNVSYDVLDYTGSAVGITTDLEPVDGKFVVRARAPTPSSPRSS